MPSIDRDLTEDELAEAQDRWPDRSPAQQIAYMKASIGAREAHSQVVDQTTGQRAFGGPQPGSGRKRKKRIGEEVLELASGPRQKDVVDALFSGLDKSEPATTRVRTAKVIADISHREAELALDEERFDDEPKRALLDFLGPVFARLSAKGELPQIPGLNMPALPRAPAEEVIEGRVSGD